MVILFLGVLHIYIITIVYQQSREQKRVGAKRQLAPGANSPGLPYFVPRYAYSVHSLVLIDVVLKKRKQTEFKKKQKYIYLVESNYPVQL